jgi:putative addiction module component (TIGR02574 family)
MEVPTKLLREVLKLTPAQRVALIDNLLASLDTPDKAIAALWAEEVEDRIDAYEQGKLKAVTLEQVLEKYK